MDIFNQGPYKSQFCITLVDALVFQENWLAITFTWHNDPKCALVGCDHPCTLGHLLSCCKLSLDRFKFRHDSCLAFLVQKLVKTAPKGITITADLNGWRVAGGTVHPDLALTGQVPDIVIHDKTSSPHKIVLLELTCPWDTASKQAESRKTLRYERLAAGHVVHLQPGLLQVRREPLKFSAVQCTPLHC